MANSLLFPVLDIEQELQLDDRTRLSALNSFVGTGGAPATDLILTPEDSADSVSIFSSGDSTVWYLDWMYQDFIFDIDYENSFIDFAEAGQVAYARVLDGSYTLAQLASAIKVALELASPESLTYSVSYDSQDRITISAAASLFLYPETGVNKENQLLKHIGFRKESKLAGFTSLTGKRTEYVIKRASLNMVDANTPTIGDVTISKFIKVFSEGGDNLWSNDSQIREHEPNISKFIPDGRSSFITQHRLAQKEILKWLDKEGYVDIYNDPFDKSSLPKIEEVEQWSKFLTLRLIFQSAIVSGNDVFKEKSLFYKGLEVEARNRAVLRLDVDGDGVVDTFENIAMASGSLVRR